MSTSSELHRAAADILTREAWVVHYRTARDAIQADVLEHRAALPPTTTLKVGGERIEHTVKVVTTKASSRRSASLEKVRRANPVAYGAALRLVPPKTPHTLFIEATRRGKKSADWEAVRAAAITDAQQQLAAKYGEWAWSMSNQLRVMFELEEMIKRSTAKADAERGELLAAILASGTLEHIVGAVDGKLRVHPNQPKRALDLDVLARYPDAGNLITVTPIASRTYIHMAEYIDNDPEGDESPEQWYDRTHR